MSAARGSKKGDVAAAGPAVKYIVTDETHSPRAASGIAARTTIDEKHNEMLKLFDHNERVAIPAIDTQLAAARATLESTSRAEVDARLDTVDLIKRLQRRRKALVDQKTRYFAENATYIFDYFERKKEISAGTSSQNTTSVNSFFKIGTPAAPAASATAGAHQHSKRMYRAYWKNVASDITDGPHAKTDVCGQCGTGELISQEDEGVLICNNARCGAFEPYIVDGCKHSNTDVPNEATYTAYIRLNHFKEILSQFQAKETTQIPEHVIDAIRKRIKKERITDKDALNYDKMREILRKLGLNKYFEHIQYINSIFGIKPPIMCEELHETLCVLFIEIQKPWAMHCPPHRTNFFNYTYTLYQLCVLLDQRQYLPYISQLKDIEKQREQDYTWQKVCRELDWEFYPTA
jgi:Ca2+-binding EF-hand superfamily protein